MTNNTGWAAGRLNGGLAWTAAFGTELNSLATGHSVLSSVSFANAASGKLDQFSELSSQLTIASSTLTGTPTIKIWLALLMADGTTYGDGIAGASAAYTPAWSPWLTIPIGTGTGITVANGFGLGLILPMGTFKLIVQNNLGFALAASGNAIDIRTGNQALNL